MITTPITIDLVHGALELEQTPDGILLHRLPVWARAQNIDPQFAMVEAQPSGIRLAFRTTATRLELDALPTKRLYPGMPPRPHGQFQLEVDGRLIATASIETGKVLRIDMGTGTMTEEAGAPGTLGFDLPAGDKAIKLWLPHNETTELVALRSNSPITPIGRSGKRWVHHGSSISQGSNATAPTDIWPVAAARATGFDLTNLGFGGSAQLDPFVARIIRDLPADLISLKLGINLVNGDMMRRRAFGPAVHGYLDTIRDGHPTTPILIISPIHCAIHEDTPGPAAFDMEALARGDLRFRASGNPAEVAAGKMTLKTIRNDLAAIVAARARTDANLHYVDGLGLYGAADAERHPLPDALHPDTATHRLIAERFAAGTLAAFV